MATRRQEKVARVVKEAVSEAITQHLNDPRIEGFVSVTRVDLAGDLRSADIYLSILGKDTAAQNKTFAAISHAKSRIQSFLAGRACISQKQVMGWRIQVFRTISRIQIQGKRPLYRTQTNLW